MPICCMRACLNSVGARRRAILISYFAEPLYASHLEAMGLRCIGMDTSDRFDPADFALGGTGKKAMDLSIG